MDNQQNNNRNQSQQSSASSQGTQLPKFNVQQQPQSGVPQQQVNNNQQPVAQPPQSQQQPMNNQQRGAQSLRLPQQQVQQQNVQAPAPSMSQQPVQQQVNVQNGQNIQQQYNQPQPYNQQPANPSGKKKSKKGLVIGLAVIAGILILATISVLFFNVMSRQQLLMPDNQTQSSQQNSGSSAVDNISSTLSSQKNWKESKSSDKKAALSKNDLEKILKDNGFQYVNGSSAVSYLGASNYKDKLDLNSSYMATKNIQSNGEQVQIRYYTFNNSQDAQNFYIGWAKSMHDETQIVSESATKGSNFYSFNIEFSTGEYDKATFVDDKTVCITLNSLIGDEAIDKSKGKQEVNKIMDAMKY